MCLDKEKGKVLEHVSFAKPMCAAAILCSCLFASPLQSYAAGSQSPAAAAADLEARVVFTEQTTTSGEVASSMPSKLS